MEDGSLEEGAPVESDPRWQPAFLSGFLILALGGLCVFFWLKQEEGAGSLPVLGIIPEFRMQDQNGAVFDSTTLRGKVWVASFIFTTCMSACPEMTKQMRLLQERLSAESGLPEEVRLVSFSVDPARDTPEVLSAFASEYRADAKRWHFLTGKAEDTAALSQQGFLLSASAAVAGGIPTHSNRFCLVDAQGRLRWHYTPVLQPGELSRLFEDIKHLLEEESGAPTEEVTRQ